MLIRLLSAAIAGGAALHASAGIVPAAATNDNGVSALGKRSSWAKRAIPETHRVHERAMPHWMSDWTKGERIPGDAVLPVRIGLKQSNLKEGHDRLMDISDHKSPNFGKYLTAEEVIDFFAPAQASVDAVSDWLMSAGLTAEQFGQSVNKQWMQLDLPASQLEDLLLTDFHIYNHPETGSKDIACDAYHLPKEVREHVDYVTPGIRMRKDINKIREKRSQTGFRDHHLGKRGFRPTNTGLAPISDEPNVPVPNLIPLNTSVCDTYITNDCIRRQYKIPLGSTAVAGNELGIFEDINQHYGQNDLDVFFSTLFPAIPNGTHPIEDLIDGAIGAAQDASEVGTEANLDFEAAWPLIWPQKTVLFQADDQFYEINQGLANTTYLGFYNTFLDAIDGSYCTYSAYGETGDCTTADCLDPTYPDPNPGGYKGQRQCGVYKPTNVISVSYSGGELDLPASYIKRQCDEFMKLGMQGVTSVMSSGDYGVGSYPGDFNLTTGCAGPKGTVFYPQTSSTCPYVLSVGSTVFERNPTTGSRCNLTEVATDRFPSGGGFSNYFDMPAYQAAAVETYFATTPLNFSGYLETGNNYSAVGNGVYKIGGRGYPDVSAIGDNFVFRSGGKWGLVGGTSLSAPVWASVLTRINEERLAAGKKTVGYVNPTFYANPDVFTDITVGSNPNCNTTGFLAAKGWDPVTGLGSPVYPKLLALYMSLP